MLVIKIRNDLCCGSRLCIKTAPEVFQLDKQGYNNMDGKPVPPGQEQAARRGAAICPESAIRLVQSDAVSSEPDATSPGIPLRAGGA